MAASLDSPSPLPLKTSPLFSPASDKRFWSALCCRIDTILENRLCKAPTEQHQLNLDDGGVGKSDRTKRMKEDSLLLLRGFDSIAQTLSHLSNNLDNAIQGARCLAEPPTLAQIFNNNLRSSQIQQDDAQKQLNEEEKIKGVKRKFDHTQNSVEQNPIDDKLKKAKNLAVSMATKAASLARELKSMKSDLCFMQERCNLLEEENARLRDGFSKGMRAEEDDLMRLQMEALLAEKSRLATENANLVRENQCLNQLVEYHQLTSHDLSASYEQLIQGMCLDFSSPSSITNQDDDDAEDILPTPRTSTCGLSTSLDQSFQEEQH